VCVLVAFARGGEEGGVKLGVLQLNLADQYPSSLVSYVFVLAVWVMRPRTSVSNLLVYERRFQQFLLTKLAGCSSIYIILSVILFCFISSVLSIIYENKNILLIHGF
jgi:hypothetical protein